MVIDHHLKLLHLLTYINRFLMQPNAVQTELRTKRSFALLCFAYKVLRCTSGANPFGFVRRRIPFTFLQSGALYAWRIPFTFLQSGALYAWRIPFKPFGFESRIAVAKLWYPLRTKLVQTEGMHLLTRLYEVLVCTSFVRTTFFALHLRCITVGAYKASTNQYFVKPCSNGLQSLRCVQS